MIVLEVLIFLGVIGLMFGGVYYDAKGGRN